MSEIILSISEEAYSYVVPSDSTAASSTIPSGHGTKGRITEKDTVASADETEIFPFMSPTSSLTIASPRPVWLSNSERVFPALLKGSNMLSNFSGGISEPLLVTVNDSHSEPSGTISTPSGAEERAIFTLT